MKKLIAILLVAFFLSVNVYTQTSWPTATPESVGMIKDSLLALENAINSGKHGYVDGILITRNGKLIYEKTWKHDYDKIYGEAARTKSPLNPYDPGGQYNYFNPWWHPYYRRGELHSLQSVTKTITSVIIGVATTRKEFPELSTRVLSFFDTTQVKNIDDRKRRMTIQHLLTMTAGFKWNESLPYNDPANDGTQMEASFDWVQFVIDKPMAFEPGEHFAYNSGASQLLSYVFRKATGKDIEEYAAQYLFASLGIKEYFWKRIPTGLADTEGGFYLKPADLAKIFYLFLQNGNWNGMQLVSREWVQSSVTPYKTVVPGVAYGYKWWLYSYGADNSKTAWCGNGFGGQFPIIIPEYNIVAVVNAWNTQGGPGLGVRAAINRLVNAIKK
jgi:CubicO group peptidase (beta-lactamase class C family)